MNVVVFDRFQVEQQRLLHLDRFIPETRADTNEISIVAILQTFIAIWKHTGLRMWSSYAWRGLTEDGQMELFDHLIQFVDLPLERLRFDRLNLVDVLQEEVLPLRENVEKVLDHRANLVLDRRALDREILDGARRLLQRLVEMVEQRLRFHEKLLGQLARVVDRVLQRRERVLLSMMDLTFVTVGTRAHITIVRGFQG